MSSKIGALFLLSAPSGAGKTTLANMIIADIGQTLNLSRLVTYTDRPPRSSDVIGVDYHFLSNHEFEQKIAQGFFLEWSCAYGAHYGTPNTIIDDISCGKSYIAVVDRAGVYSLLSCYQDAVAILIEPPSLNVLEQRLRARNTEREEHIQRRLCLAREEMISEQSSQIYTHRICNDELDKAYCELKCLITETLTHTNSNT
jgi:guanylate kinase